MGASWGFANLYFERKVSSRSPNRVGSAVAAPSNVLGCAATSLSTSESAAGGPGRAGPGVPAPPCVQVRRE